MSELANACRTRGTTTNANDHVYVIVNDNVNEPLRTPLLLTDTTDHTAQIKRRRPFKENSLFPCEKEERTLHRD